MRVHASYKVVEEMGCNLRKIWMKFEFSIRKLMKKLQVKFRVVQYELANTGMELSGIPPGKKNKAES